MKQKYSFIKMASACLCLLIAQIHISYAKEAQGAEFLLLGLNAKASAMAEGMDAVINFSNPAAASLVENTEISLTHNEWLEGMKHEFFGLNQNIAGVGVLGINATYLHSEIQGYDMAGAKGSAFQNYDLCAAVSFASDLSETLSAGLACKIVQQKLESENAQGQAVDLGFIYKTDKLNIGASVLNLGTKMKFIQEEYSLPLVANIGASYAFNFTTIGLNVKHQPNQQYTSIGIGAEYRLMEFFSVRSGYTLKQENLLDIMMGVSVGVGFKFSQYSVDYCFNPYADLGQAHKISINLKFGGHDQYPKLINFKNAAKIAKSLGKRQ